MKTRFSLEFVLTEDEHLRLYQVSQYLIEFKTGDALVPRELADFIAGPDAKGDRPERRFKDFIGHDDPGFEFVRAGEHALRIYDIDGSPNLRMLCQIIAHVVPRVIPLEFSFALLDEDEHRFSGGIVVMTAHSAEIQTIDSMLARRGGHMLH